MLQILRNKAQSTIIQAIVVIIALVFIFWGVGSNLMNNREAAVTVNGEEISFQEFQSAYDRAYENMAAQFGGTLPKGMAEVLNIKQQVINQLVQGTLLRQGAQEMGLMVSQEEIQTAINGMVQFQESGVFSLDKYEALLASNRLTPGKYESNMRYDMLTEKVVRAISGFASASSEFEIKELYKQDKEEVSVDYISVGPEQFLEIVEVNDEELEKWYSENSSRYNSETEVKLEYLPFTYSLVGEKITIDPARVEEYYGQNSAQFSTPEKRHARHILIKTEESDSAELKAEQRKKAEEIAQLAKADSDFAALAKEYSEGPSGPSGGDLGFFSRGQMVPAFDLAVFTMQPGDISEVVETQFGYHVIKLEEIQPATTESLEQAREKIVATLRGQEAKKLARQMVTAAYEGIIGAGSLTAYAENNKEQEIQSTDFFSRSQPPAQLASDTAFIDKAFTLKKGELSSIVETDNGFFILSATDIKDPQTPALDQVKEKAVADLKAEKAAGEAEDTATKFLERAKAGEQFGELSSEYGLTEKNSGLMGRTTPPESGFPASLVESVFTLSASEPFPESPGNVGGTFYIYQFKERKLPEAGEDVDLDKYSQMLLASKRQQILGAFIANLQEKATITQHQSL